MPALGDLRLATCDFQLRTLNLYLLPLLLDLPTRYHADFRTCPPPDLAANYRPKEVSTAWYARHQLATPCFVANELRVNARSRHASQQGQRRCAHSQTILLWSLTDSRQREALATSFKCVFCNHETSVSVKIDKKAGVGNLNCKSCGQSFQTGTTYLSQPVDVYSDWIDACDAVAKDTATSNPTQPTFRQPQAAASRGGLAPNEKPSAEDDGFIDDDGVDAEADYDDE